MDARAKLSILAESLIIGPVSTPSHLAHLPAPPAEALAASERLNALVKEDIAAHAGWVSFARFMEWALYAPGLGYYSAGSRKFGAAGDFVTAPELSPLFGRCLARQLAELLDEGLPDVLEIGAGTGALAAEILAELAALGRLPQRYLILEVSADLRERQRATLAARVPDALARVQWLEVLPGPLEAVMIGNEVLDAIPTHLVRIEHGRVMEVGVTVSDAGAYAWAARPAEGELLAAARELDVPEGYETEINLAARAFVGSFARLLRRGAMLFIDYGFPARELYHPQRAQGTLMCHYRHHVHDDPLHWVGLQDITSHVDFSAVAQAAQAAGAALLGYASQAQFLINCGITDLLGAVSPEDVRAYAPLAGQAQVLLSPAEMGELFKVIAFGRGIAGPLCGFARGDKRHAL